MLQIGQLTARFRHFVHVEFGRDDSRLFARFGKNLPAGRYDQRMAVA